MANPVADIFRQAAELNRRDPRREGNTVVVPAGWQLLVAGDIHGERMILNRIIAHAALAEHPQRILVLQELIHGPIDQATGQDRSVELLMRAARLKVARPQQVVLLLGNHDLAQATGKEITKAGRDACKDFAAGVSGAFEDDADEILDALSEFFLSQPMAARCANGTMVCHSLPAPNRTEAAGVEILSRESRPEDLLRGGCVYEWTWGRRHSDSQVDALAARLGVEFFVIGHQPSDIGWELATPRALIVASDHINGCVLQFDTDHPLTTELAVASLYPISAMARGGGPADGADE